MIKKEQMVPSSRTAPLHSVLFDLVRDYGDLWRRVVITVDLAGLARLGHPGLKFKPANLHRFVRSKMVSNGNGGARNLLKIAAHHANIVKVMGGVVGDLDDLSDSDQGVAVGDFHGRWKCRFSAADRR